ncbi:MAG: hypothetical protein HS126_29090 [Anaerolineales bacterium]|nr:hypothetical protein [Anaerolineales bacterium]
MSNQEAAFVKFNKTKARCWNGSSCLAVIGVIIALILITPPVARFGYCHGWWLKPTRWAYYWWLCDCGPEFEQSLSIKTA